VERTPLRGGRYRGRQGKEEERRTGRRFRVATEEKSGELDPEKKGGFFKEKRQIVKENLKEPKKKTSLAEWGRRC